MTRFQQVLATASCLVLLSSSHLLSKPLVYKVACPVVNGFCATVVMVSCAMMMPMSIHHITTECCMQAWVHRQELAKP